MLKSHMDAIENSLISNSKISGNAGHSIHKGTPREHFIKKFLENHLSSNCAIGTGEIIDSNSPPKTTRNQYDIVIYKKNFPKLDFDSGISVFLIESVIATIEVKSTLNQEGIDQAVKAANNAKSLIPNIVRPFSSGWIPPKVINYVVAYDGPAQMETVYKWILSSHKKNNIPMPKFNQQNRTQVPGTALDGVILLKKGFIKLDNSPLSFNTHQNHVLGTHFLANSPDDNLLLFFLILQEACNNIEGSWLDPIPYLKSIIFKNLKYLS